MNPESLEVLTGCKLEAELGRRPAPSLGSSSCAWVISALDNRGQPRPDHLVFNRAVSLKDSFGKGKGKK